MKNEGKINPLNHIQDLLNVMNKTQIWLSVELGVSKETINQYIKGTIKPRQEMLIQIAKLLNTSTDYILGITNNPTPPEITLDEEELVLLTNYRSLNNIDKVKAPSYIQGMIEKNN